MLTDVAVSNLYIKIINFIHILDNKISLLSLWGKRVFCPTMRFSQRRNHDQTLEWANLVEGGEYQELYGIIGKSVFFDVDGFDIIKDIPPDPMHFLDGGLIKNTCGRVFNSGSSHQTQPGYKRASITKLSDMIRYIFGHCFSFTFNYNFYTFRYIPFPSDFPRRSRVYDHPSYKCNKWRIVGTFLFPLLVRCLGQDKPHEKSIFISLGYLSRAMRLPDEEYNAIDRDIIADASNIFNEHYAAAFGPTAGSYNFHLFGSHLEEIREFLGGPFTASNAYPFEAQYAEMRRSYTSGTRKV